MGDFDTTWQFLDSTSPLTGSGGGTPQYLGAARDTGANSSPGKGYSRFRVLSNADQVGLVAVDQSPDSTTWYTTLSQPTTANTPVVIESIIVLRYVRVNFQNTSAGAQTVFRLASALVAV